MASQAIPGTYPASIPPTPADEVVQQPQYHEQQDQSHQHQRNKFHEPNNPPGHSHTDSGVGFTESEPIQPAKHNDDRRIGPSEAAGGGPYVRGDTEPYQSSQPVQLPSQQQRLNRPGNEGEFLIRKNKGEDQPVADAKAGPGVVGIGADARKQAPSSSTIENDDDTPRQSHERNEAPYWGNLPKASTGGIYNTVTGHGSANDDHDQHHHMPARGGVYNSVTGRGSQDEENRRHSQSTADDRAATAGGSNGALLAVPLGQIPERQQKQTVTPSDTNRSNDFGNDRRNDTLLADPGAAATDREVGMSRQPQSGSPTRRAFPLAPSAMSAREDETSKPDKRNSALAGTAAFGAGAMAYGIVDKHKKDQEGTQPVSDGSHVRHSKSMSEDQRHRSAGGLFSRKSRDDRRASSVEKHRSRSRSVTGDKKHKVLGLFNRHKDDDTPREDTTTYEPPAQQEHKEEPILASSGSTRTRNKLHKGSRSEPSDRKVSTSKNPTESDSSNQNKTRAAAGAAAGVGVLGLLHHKNDKDGKTPRDQATQQQPDLSFSSHPNQPLIGTTAQGSQPKRSEAGAAVGLDDLELTHRRDLAHPDPSAATVTGLATQKYEDPSTPFEHPREPPYPPRGNVDGSAPPAQLGLLASGAPRHSREESTAEPTIHSTASTDVVYGTLPSGTPSGVQPDPGRHSTNVSRRDAATHERGNNQRAVASAPGDYNVFASSGNQFRANKSSAPVSKANYNNFASSTVSGVAQDHSQSGSAHTSETRSSQQGGVKQEPGQYNHLSSGAASGVAAGIAAGGMAAGVASARNKYQPPHQSTRGPETVASQQGTNIQEPSQYNHLTSVTDSGVRRDSSFAESTGAQGIVATGSSRPSQNRTDSGPYNKLASGTPSGVKIKHKDNSRRAAEPAVYTHDQHGIDRNTSLLTSPTGAVFTQHHQSQPTVDTRINDLKDLPLPASSSSPTEAHTSSHHTVVSPPVHAPPETGKSTNPPPPANQLATPRFTPFPNEEMMRGMSPEVMPDTYRESATHLSSPREHEMSPEVMPAAYRDSVSQQDTSKSYAI